jgi:hypothetical protein
MIWSIVEISSLIVCSCIPSLRQIIQKIPWLNRAFGLSSDKPSQRYYEPSGSKGGVSIAMYSRGRKEYVQSRKSTLKGHHASAHFGMVSKAVAGPRMTNNDSTEEIFPHQTDGKGVILVTHELNRDVEFHAESLSTGTCSSQQSQSSARKDGEKD